MINIFYTFTIIIVMLIFFILKFYNERFLSLIVTPDEKYDYIIVGSGTSGCVLASRLSEDPQNKVLLIEAGSFINQFVSVPLIPTVVQMGPNDWSFRTTKQRYSSFGINDQIQILPRGKGLGGSGHINYMMHSFGLADDFNWHQYGVQNWTYSDLVPYFHKAFGTSDNEFSSGPYFGNEPKIHLTMLNADNELYKIFKEASRQNGPKSIFLRPTATVKDGSRHSTYEAYLKPVLGRKNLHVLIETQALSISTKNARSVEILQYKQKKQRVFAAKEILLSAGALKTPQILMLSGIGPKNVLERYRIKPVKIHEDVGRNLYDHANFPLYVSIEKDLSITLDRIFNVRTVWDYFWYKEGPLSFPPVSGIEILNNRTTLLMFTLGSTKEHLLKNLSNYKTESFRSSFPYQKGNNQHGFIFLCSCLHPKSRGQVTITGRSIKKPLYVDVNYLYDKYDVKCTIQAIRRAIKLISTKQFRDIGAKIHWPRNERCIHLMNDELISDSYLECIVREMSVTGHHIGGTCRLGSVVDERFRLFGVNGVRIVDGSIVPRPISLYPNSVLIAMAERAAQFIAHDNI